MNQRPKVPEYLLSSFYAVLPFFLFLLSISISISSFSQKQLDEKLAKEAVYRIVQYSGLSPNFIVRENSQVKTAIAYVRNKKRYIEYNKDIISGIMDSTNTDWSAVSILAHEIAHHLLGHTINPGRLKPGDELACDRYSGFILQSMGATLEEALAAMSVHGSTHGSKSHPPKQARLDAIEQGWKESRRLKLNEKSVVFNESPEFKYILQFEGDENNYYVDGDNNILWYNNYGKPIEFGSMIPLEKGDFHYELNWSGQSYFVDGSLNIWQTMEYQAQMIVGEIFEIETEAEAETETKPETEIENRNRK